MHDFDDLIIGTFPSVNGLHTTLAIEPRPGDLNGSKQLVFRHYWLCFNYKNVALQTKQDFIKNLLKVKHGGSINDVITLDAFMVSLKWFETNLNPRMDHAEDGIVENRLRTIESKALEYLNVRSGEHGKYLSITLKISLLDGTAFLQFWDFKGSITIGNVYGGDNGLYDMWSELNCLITDDSFKDRFVRVV
jgi:hypothetical protein